jgi:hypothetical protein
MARTGMATLIEQVRLLANVGTAEWTIGTVSYWTDNQVQAQLDAHRRDFVEDVLPQGVNVTGTVEYHDYRLSYGNLEDIGSGTAAWSVRDTGGTLYGTADYSAAYDVGLISFTADTAGSPMVVRYRAYDPYSAAADIWRSRAANVSLYYDIREGEHSLSRSQMFSHCMLQATILDNMAGAGVNQMTRMYRSDLN